MNEPILTQTEIYYFVKNNRLIESISVKRLSFQSVLRILNNNCIDKKYQKLKQEEGYMLDFPIRNNEHLFEYSNSKYVYVSLSNVNPNFLIPKVEKIVNDYPNLTVNFSVIDDRVLFVIHDISIDLIY